MLHKIYRTITGNEAAALMAYKTNEVCAIYPITPASGMSELVEEWSSNQNQNIFGSIPTAYEMQSEAGVAGALHGAIQTGALGTTFTASQGLLLMAPNMYKMAGELSPHVIHVATRSIATHALSVFGDHSDIMAVRSTGYAFLGAASVQEAMDFSLIAQAATLESRIPFVHFFDGFRTSHETAKIELVTDIVIDSMIDSDWIDAHRKRALNPEKPVLRGTSQGSDVFFQSREASNSFYDACPNIVQEAMNRFSELTGRAYKLFDYIGDPSAEQVVVAMASATATLEETILHLNKKGERIGLIKVRLFRPFSTEHLIAALPNTCKSIAVLDRTKEPGSSGEPLYLDVLHSVMAAFSQKHFVEMPTIVGGRYGLSSKEFTPSMVRAIVENLKLASPKNNFTVGIKDDLTHTDLILPAPLSFQEHNYQALFYETRNAMSKIRFDELIQLMGDTPGTIVQGFSECDYNKSHGIQISHLRMSSEEIKAPYLIESANFIACDQKAFESDVSILKKIKRKGCLLVASPWNSDDFWKQVSPQKQELLRAKEVAVFMVAENNLEYQVSSTKRTLSGLPAYFLAFQNNMPQINNLCDLQWKIVKVATQKNESVVLDALEKDPAYSNTLLGMLLSGRGDEIPVSAFPVDGTYDTNTSAFNLLQTTTKTPVWDAEACTQCGACSMACPTAALRSKLLDPVAVLKAPTSFLSTPWFENESEIDLLHYTIQVNNDHCTACSNCVDACEVDAISLESSLDKKTTNENWNYFDGIPEVNRQEIDLTKVSQQQLQEPLFKYPLAVDGCGETPYLKLVSQLFGDRMLVANATGASSIFGGALPTTPWSKNDHGRGPAWSNSLFEDNAEFGLGYRLSLDQQEQQAKLWLEDLIGIIDIDLIFDILNATQNSEATINEQRERIARLKNELIAVNSEECNKLLSIVDSLVKKSVWIVGGDGWAYDIGYGGLDHVLASGKNVNILVLDNEVYDNTGGQMSKATPMGAKATFATKGKKRQKKDLGLMAMNYEDVYVASVAIGADQEQTLLAFLEAESYDGPSLIIAYCHSDSHGIDMKTPSIYHKAAVASGQWLLYRNDPRRKPNHNSTLQLDSKSPSIAITEYLRLEGRFSELFSDLSADKLKELSGAMQAHVDQRFNNYLAKTMSLFEVG